MENLVLLLYTYVNQWPVSYTYHTWQNIEGDKYWRMYAYQTFGSNELVNNLSSTCKIFQSQNLVR